MALRALKNLEVIDDEYLSHSIKLDSVFSFESYPFKRYWLEEDTPLFTLKEKVNDFDMASKSEKTHPEIDFRIAKIKNEFDVSDVGEADSSHLEKINEKVIVQSIKYTIDHKLLDLAIYQLIHKFNLKLISSDYYYSTMASVWMQLYEARKNHALGKYVPSKNSFSSENELNKIRLFLHNLELNEIRNLGFAFCEENQSKINNNELFNQSFNFFKP